MHTCLYIYDYKYMIIFKWLYIYIVCVCTYTCMCSHVLVVYDILCAFAVVLLYTAGSVQWPFFIRVSTPFALFTLFSLQWYNPWAGNSVLEQPVLNNAHLQNCRVGMTCSPQNFRCWASKSNRSDEYDWLQKLYPTNSRYIYPIMICILIKLLALPCFTHIFVTFGQFKFVK